MGEADQMLWIKALHGSLSGHRKEKSALIFIFIFINFVGGGGKSVTPPSPISLNGGSFHKNGQIPSSKAFLIPQIVYSWKAMAITHGFPIQTSIVGAKAEEYVDGQLWEIKWLIEHYY